MSIVLSREYILTTGKNPPVKVSISVPNLKNPFLGVHYTITVNNEVKSGPTSIPAFWRENYTGFDNFDFELINVQVLKKLFKKIVLVSGFSSRNKKI